jgi:hypothetical protein
MDRVDGGAAALAKDAAAIKKKQPKPRPTLPLPMLDPTPLEEPDGLKQFRQGKRQFRSTGLQPDAGIGTSFQKFIAAFCDGVNSYRTYFVTDVDY